MHLASGRGRQQRGRATDRRVALRLSLGDGPGSWSRLLPEHRRAVSTDEATYRTIAASSDREGFAWHEVEAQPTTARAACGWRYPRLMRLWA